MGSAMSDHVYKTVERTGTSEDSIEDAANTAIRKASKTIRNLRWFEVTQTRGEIARDHVSHWQVTMKVGFTLDG